MVGYQPKCLDFMRTMNAEPWHSRSDTISATGLLDQILALYADLDSVQREQFAAAQEFKGRLRRFKARAMAEMAETTHRS